MLIWMIVVCKYVCIIAYGSLVSNFVLVVLAMVLIIDEVNCCQQLSFFEDIWPKPHLTGFTYRNLVELGFWKKLKI